MGRSSSSSVLSSSFGIMRRLPVTAMASWVLLEKPVSSRILETCHLTVLTVMFNSCAISLYSSPFAVLGSHPCIVQTFFFIIPDGIVIVPCTVLHAFSDQSVKTTFVKCNLTKKWGRKLKNGIRAVEITRLKIPRAYYGKREEPSPPCAFILCSYSFAGFSDSASRPNSQYSFLR